MFMRRGRGGFIGIRMRQNTDMREHRHDGEGDDYPCRQTPCEASHRSLDYIEPPERVRAASARRKKLPAETTFSPALRPSTTCAASPTAWPSFTGRSVNLPSASSAET